MDKKEKIKRLAEELMLQIRNEILLEHRYFDLALFYLEPCASDMKISMTDGKILYYNPEKIIKRAKLEYGELKKDYLHSLLHCIYYHPFVGTDFERHLWNLATDIVVESVVHDLVKEERQRGGREFRQRTFINGWIDRIGTLTAEKLYYHLLDAELPEEEYRELQDLFLRDGHVLWGEREMEESWQEDDAVSLSSTSKPNRSEVPGDWERIGEKLKIQLEYHGQGENSALKTIRQTLEVLEREKYDYARFLTRFAIAGEELLINDEEFDYIYYSYGMELYGNIPLINPLEYKEVVKIREFVIALDTSGSVRGELVQAFVQKTYNILKQKESFYSKIVLYVVQCDTEIRRVDRLSSAEQIEEYIEDFELEGFGGTDFRPVFEFVDEKRREGELRNLKGIIYFTDGRGVFPETVPQYNAAFIYLEEIPENYPPPIWASTVVLERVALSDGMKHR